MSSLPHAFKLTPEVEENARFYDPRLTAKSCHLCTYMNAPYPRLCFVILAPISELVIVIHPHLAVQLKSCSLPFCLYDDICTQTHANAHTHVHIPDQHNNTVSPIYKGSLV